MTVRQGRDAASGQTPVDLVDLEHLAGPGPQPVDRGLHGGRSERRQRYGLAGGLRLESGARLPYKMRKDSGACIERESAIVNVGKDDLWRDVAYGTPVSQQDNDPDSTIRSKIRTLFQYIEDSQVDSDSGSGSEDSLDSQEISDGISDVF